MADVCVPGGVVWPAPGPYSSYPGHPVTMDPVSTAPAPAGWWDGLVIAPGYDAWAQGFVLGMGFFQRAPATCEFPPKRSLVLSVYGAYQDTTCIAANRYEVTLLQGPWNRGDIPPTPQFVPVPGISYFHREGYQHDYNYHWQIYDGDLRIVKAWNDSVTARQDGPYITGIKLQYRVSATKNPTAEFNDVDESFATVMEGGPYGWYWLLDQLDRSMNYQFRYWYTLSDNVPALGSGPSATIPAIDSGVYTAQVYSCLAVTPNGGYLLRRTEPGMLAYQIPTELPDDPLDKLVVVYDSEGTLVDRIEYASTNWGPGDYFSFSNWDATDYLFQVHQSPPQGYGRYTVHLLEYNAAIADTRDAYWFEKKWCIDYGGDFNRPWYCARDNPNAWIECVTGDPQDIVDSGLELISGPYANSTECAKACPGVVTDEEKKCCANDKPC